MRVPRVAIIIDGPAGRPVADWLAGLVCRRGDLEVDLIDLSVACLPDLPTGDLPTPPAVRDLAPWLAFADGFVVVVPQSCMENAVGWYAAAWRAKPVAFAASSGDPPAMHELRSLFIAAHAVLIDDVVRYPDHSQADRMWAALFPPAQRKD